MSNMWCTIAKETGDKIDMFETKQDAVDEIKRYEDQDSADGVYEHDFYDIEEEV